MCYSEVLIFVRNNESFCIKKSSVLCASLNSKNNFYGVVFFIYAVCYSIFCAVQQLPVVTEFQRLNVTYKTWSSLYSLPVMDIQNL